jgi:hypothetical protein
MSASRRPTRWPSRASATARLAATVDFPTPPLPEATATTCATSGMSLASRAIACCVLSPRAGGVCSRSSTCAERTPGSFPSIASVCSRTWRAASALPVTMASTTSTAPSRTATLSTKPKETMSRLIPGKRTVRSASQTWVSRGSAMGR